VVEACGTIKHPYAAAEPAASEEADVSNKRHWRQCFADCSTQRAIAGPPWRAVQAYGSDRQPLACGCVVRFCQFTRLVAASIGEDMHQHCSGHSLYTKLVVVCDSVDGRLQAPLFLARATQAKIFDSGGNDHDVRQRKAELIFFGVLGDVPALRSSPGAQQHKKRSFCCWCLLQTRTIELCRNVCPY
jgi:hypothetical protein